MQKQTIITVCGIQLFNFLSSIDCFTRFSFLIRKAVSGSSMKYVSCLKMSKGNCDTRSQEKENIFQTYGNKDFQLHMKLFTQALSFSPSQSSHAHPEISSSTFFLMRDIHSMIVLVIQPALYYHLIPQTASYETIQGGILGGLSITQIAAKLSAVAG